MAERPPTEPPLVDDKAATRYATGMIWLAVVLDIPFDPDDAHDKIPREIMRRVELAEKRTIRYREHLSRACPLCDKRDCDDPEHWSIGLLRQEIRELRKRDKAIEQVLLDVLGQAIGPDDFTAEWDSRALSAYADGMRLLAERGRLRITHEAGRRVFAFENPETRPKETEPSE